MKVLIYRMGGLGDSLLIYPVLEVLTKKGYEITVWGNPEYFLLAKISGICSKVTFYEPTGDFDIRIIFSGNKEIFKFQDNSIYINPIPDEKIWIVDYYLKKLNLSNESFSKILELGFNVEKTTDLCIIHPGSGSKKKNPEKSFFLELENFLQKRGFKILYILGPAEKELSKFYKNCIYFENLIDMAKTLLKASIYIGLDSGISHLSSYLGIPSIIIFGPTDPHVWHPIGENFWIIRYENCPPCYPNICEEKKCLHKDFLIKQIDKLLSSSTTSKVKPSRLIL